MTHADLTTLLEIRATLRLCDDLVDAAIRCGNRIDAERFLETVTEEKILKQGSGILAIIVELTCRWRCDHEEQKIIQAREAERMREQTEKELDTLRAIEEDLWKSRSRS